MAEPATRRLDCRLGVGAMLRALDRSPALDTGTLACLAGRWLDGTVLVGWNPSQVREGEPVPAATRPPAAGWAASRQSSFGAGWLGWLDYRGGSWFGWFDTVLCRDDQGWRLESTRLQAAELAGLAAILEALPDLPPGPLAIDQLAGTDRKLHLAAVERAITAIRAGELYQVNVCARLSGRLRGAPLDLFDAGLTELAPDYAALISTPAGSVVSLSPELFLDCPASRQVRTAPIKGTRRRLLPGDQLDDPEAILLRQSVKDRAENVMIVDLMRNDLSRVCRPGSVRAEQLLTVRPAPGVWHLVSDVTGELRPEVDWPQLLAATFPPGSVTGAPKLRALELIAELEVADRGLFTGAIGYLSETTGRCEFNVAIRTFEISGDALQLGVGGGITASSVPIDEWQECLIKAAPLLALGGVRLADDAGQQPPPAQVELAAGVFETLLAVDGTIPALADHLDRLATSCQQLYDRRLPAGLADQLRAAVAGRPGRLRVRVTVRPDRDAPLVEVTPAGPAGGTVSLWQHAGRTGSWRHKWADRRWLAGLEAQSSGALPLFTDATGCLLETSRANLLIVPERGLLRTPVLTEQVLPGVTRRRLLDAAGDRGWRVEFAPISVGELRGARLGVTTSAISGVLGIDCLDGIALDLDRELLAELAGWLG